MRDLLFEIVNLPWLLWCRLFGHLPNEIWDDGPVGVSADRWMISVCPRCGTVSNSFVMQGGLDD